MSRKVYVIGGYVTDFTGKGSKSFVKGERDLKSYMNEAVQGAMTDAGVTSQAVDRCGASLLQTWLHVARLLLAGQATHSLLAT